jgi:hypothetical protein
LRPGWPANSELSFESKFSLNALRQYQNHLLAVHLYFQGWYYFKP